MQWCTLPVVRDRTTGDSTGLFASTAPNAMQPRGVTCCRAASVRVALQAAGNTVVSFTCVQDHIYIPHAEHCRAGMVLYSFINPESSLRDPVQTVGRPRRRASGPNSRDIIMHDSATLFTGRARTSGAGRGTPTQLWHEFS